MQSGNIENFRELSQFKDLKDFNNNIEQWMIDVKNYFTKSEIVALKRLIRFSAKVAGVCNAKIGTIVAATQIKDGSGISRSTFKRMITKAKNLGLISIYNTVRMNGSKSSNVYVFNSLYAYSEPSKSEKLNRPQTSNLYKTNNKNNINKRNTGATIKQQSNNYEVKSKVLDASFTSDRVPKEFINFVKNFYNDAKQIETYWKLVSISAYKNNIIGDIIEPAIQAFKALVRKVKFSSISNTYGYFYGILRNKLKAKYFVDLFKDVYNSLQ